MEDIYSKDPNGQCNTDSNEFIKNGLVLKYSHNEILPPSRILSKFKQDQTDLGSNIEYELEKPTKRKLKTT